VGIVSVLTAVTLWAIFLLGTRWGVSGNFSVEEVLLLRLLTATVITVPFMIKLGVLVRGQGVVSIFMLTLGSSAVFPYLISLGLFYASASDAGAMAPGMLPFWTALFSWLILGEVVTRIRLFGLAIILSGALLVGLWQMVSGSEPDAWKGHLLFLLGAGSFSIYTIYFRQSGLSPLHGLVIGLFWGTLTFVPFLILSGNISFSEVSWYQIANMSILQGVLNAVVALLLYSIAVRQIGTAQAGAFGALTPILALLGGAIFLNETVTMIKTFGVVLVASGVLMASGVFEKKS
jgi:drug/metabolite transporter (DMT)-like permease